MEASAWCFRKNKCFGLTGKGGVILVSHCLLLARFYIFSCKYKGSKPSIVEMNIIIMLIEDNFITEKKFQSLNEPRKLKIGIGNKLFRKDI